MGDYGVRVSSPGKDVFNNGDVDMVFSTKFLNSMTLQTYGSVDVTTNDETGGTGIINHALGYVPFYSAVAMVEGSAFRSVNVLAAYNKDFFTGYGYSLQSLVTKDNLYLYVQPDYGIGAKTIRFFYLIGRDPIRR